MHCVALVPAVVHDDVVALGGRTVLVANLSGGGIRGRGDHHRGYGAGAQDHGSQSRETGARGHINSSMSSREARGPAVAGPLEELQLVTSTQVAEQVRVGVVFVPLKLAWKPKVVLPPALMTLL